MPLFELTDAAELVPFRRLHASAEVYEREIGDLVWKSFEEIIAEPLFRVARSPSLTVGQPEVVALDEHARVVLITVQRDLGRSELAEGLEYAGWARKTNLDELAALYHRGRDAFFVEWQAFTDSSAAQRVRRPPRLVLVARGIHPRTEPAFDFLVEHSVPVRVLRVALYEDLQGRRYVDVEHAAEGESGGDGSAHGGTATREEAVLEERGIRLTDLLEEGLVSPGDRLIWARPGTGDVYYASFTENGCIRLEDGRVFSGPSRAATEAAGIAAYDGWQAWRVGGSDGELLDELRVRLLRKWAEIEGEPTDEVEEKGQREPTIELEDASDGRDGSSDEAPGGDRRTTPSPSGG